ncbi:MAG TPA: RNase adapter RapZ [Candidatus Obscuribacter sp.]|nr:RNase adapter RapZ [Candidatus Obscuribacter sp.]HND08021.1 RNase adapter RapZ [Candidatus Obscuribacter sp.]HND66824.1 RNase adapter RapZ [Candidatus Obscuribacter sp.]HNG18112.1 RNase adapter RapZ [Candidatus Obscuribacter sp.]HNG73759.1 RNase adapter RapZ [Candidatus Obscuribacter sp.]
MNRHDNSNQSHSAASGRRLVRVVSFGFKKAAPPIDANLLFDVRFLKNPYWVEELRPLTGLDLPVRNYVMEQDLARQFLANLLQMVEQVMPSMFETKSNVFTIALGCTGGQHRSVSVAETLAQELQKRYPEVDLEVQHRELHQPIDVELTVKSASSAAGGGPSP